jgi:outer membrane lipoprotein-sorting protein
MANRFLVLALMLGGVLGCTTARAADDGAAAGAVAGLSADPSLDQVLDALDRRGRDMKTLRADVRLTDNDLVMGDKVSRTGTFVLENRADGSSRAHVLFKVKEEGEKGEKKTQEKIEYILDGGKLIDRNYTKSTQNTQVVLRPGEKMNLLKLGEGPFPLPIGQSKEEVHRAFDAKKIDPAKDDPPGTVHVQLIPKADTSLARKFKVIDVWVSTKDEMPQRITTLEPNETNERVVDLNNVKVNAPVSDADFQMDKIDETKWTLHDSAYQDSGKR